MGNRKKVIAVVSGICLVLVAIGILAFGGEDNNSSANKSIFPEQLLELPLIEYVDGQAAVGSIAQMHGTQVGTKEGYIATYGNETEDKLIRIWISIDPADKAKALFEVMDKKISTNPEVPFKNRQEVEVNGIEVIYVTGMGQDHYYWVSGERNYWVALGGFEDSKSTLEEVIKLLENSKQ